ncbi:MAG: anthranilate synthase component I family protein [Firmicutes bacterium]|nr:anthranilate synthase component I family protein [Bacillota bacterium]
MKKTLYPTREAVRHYAESGNYRRVPICRELMADRFTPVEVMRILAAADKHCFLLESAEQNQRWGRWSFLGCDPTVEITSNDGALRVREETDDGEISVKEASVSRPKDEIRKILSEYKSPYIDGMPPFSGGLVGYFSYDYIKYSEPTLSFDNLDGGDFRDVDLMLFDRVIAFDGYRQKIFVIAGVDVSDSDRIDSAYDEASLAIDNIVSLITSGVRAYFPKLHLKDELKPKFSREEYGSMVERGKHYIKEGDIFQVVLSNPQTAPAEGSLFDTYRVLRSANPSPYMFYFRSDDIEIAGASPETLVKLENGTLHTFPLAGTRPRGATDEEDLALEKSLLADEKELAEHNMLVDLGRNDIGRISELGSVKMESYLDILRFSHVMHIGSTVRGTIKEGMDALDAIDSILPAGTLSGAPKLRACEIISELEGERRGIYGGAVGYLDFTGNLDTCIAIRLAYKKNGVITVRSGAGIVADSVPDREFDECINKAFAVVSALHTAEEGLE